MYYTFQLGWEKSMTASLDWLKKDPLFFPARDIVNYLNLKSSTWLNWIRFIPNGNKYWEIRRKKKINKQNKTRYIIIIATTK